MFRRERERERARESAPDTMFLKKLLGSNNDNRQERGKTDRAAPPQGVQTMGVNLQRKFAKGVQYNSEYRFT